MSHGNAVPASHRHELETALAETLGAAGVRYEELVLGYERRHAMRPGITGLAQANGLRGPTSEVEPSVMRVVRDIEYIRDFSVWLDIRILVRTVINEILRGKGF